MEWWLVFAAAIGNQKTAETVLTSRFSDEARTVEEDQNNPARVDDEEHGFRILRPRMRRSSCGTVWRSNHRFLKDGDESLAQGSLPCGAR